MTNRWVFMILGKQNVPGVRPRLRMLEIVENGEDETGLMPHGVTGEESVGSIPFQVIFCC